MKDEYKTKKQLIQELTEARNRIAKKEDASGDIVAGREIVRNITERKEAEKELKVFQDLINRTNDAIFVIDPETSRFLNVNEKTCSNLGYQREELFSMSVTDIEAVLPNRFSWSEHVKAVKKAGHMILEGRHKHKDGTEFPVEVSVTYIQCQPKDYMVAVVRDVTERKKAAEALTAVRGKAEAEHAKAEAIVAALGAGIGILDRDFKLLYQNQAHRDILGGHSGEYCYQAFHERDHVCESCPVEMTFADGNIHTVERTVPGDEGERFIEVTTSPLKDRTGTIVAGIEVVTDITGRKLVENSRAMLREAIESLPIGITIGDLSGKIVYVNHAEAEIHGFQAAELIGKDTRMLAPPDTWEPLSFEKLYAMGTRKRESVNIRKNGDVFPVQLISRAVKNTEGVPIGIITACEDITARKEAEEKLRNAQRMEVIGTLAGGVAHEVRNPLNAIMAISEALSRDLGDNPEFQPFLGHIHTQVERLSLLMRDLLDLGKPSDQFQFHEVPLADICSASIDIWKHSRSGSKLEAHLIGAEGNGDVIVRADSSRLQQVFVNLLENAAQHSAEDTAIEMILERPKSGMCGVHVVDRGSGIPEEYLPRIFAPFFSMRRGGTGLGMSIVKHIVETHGGTVEVANNDPPPGCTIVVRLPEREKGAA